MPDTLADTRATIVRNLLYDNWSNPEGYDPSLSTTDSNFMPITTDWYDRGDIYPNVTLTNFSGTSIGGGNTGWTGTSSSGLNQYRGVTGLCTVRAEKKPNSTYNNSKDAQETIKSLTDEIESIVQDHAPGGLRDYGEGDYDQGRYGGVNYELFWFQIEPFEDTTQGQNPVEFQSQAQVGFGYLKN